MIDELFPAGWQRYLIGGLWIGTGVAVLFLVTGLVGAMSSVFSSTWSRMSKLEFFPQPLLFAAGLIVGAALCAKFVPGTATVTSLPGWQLLLGGFLVGYGAQLSNGYGICGMASPQWPSLLAALTLLGTAFVTAQLTWWIWGR